MAGPVLERHSVSDLGIHVCLGRFSSVKHVIIVSATFCSREQAKRGRLTQKPIPSRTRSKMPLERRRLDVTVGRNMSKVGSQARGKRDRAQTNGSTKPEDICAKIENEMDKVRLQRNAQRWVIARRIGPVGGP
jgi:hypothetical protein